MRLHTKHPPHLVRNFRVVAANQLQCRHREKISHEQLGGLLVLPAGPLSCPNSIPVECLDC